MGALDSDTTKLHILVVDDEADLLESLADLLGDEGYEVATASDGLEAMGELVDDTFDLVIADIRMPRVDGLELFDHLRKRSPLTDVILMTGQGTVNEAVRALKNEAADYIAKPFDVSQLLTAVEKIGGQRATRNALDQARRQLASDEGTQIVGQSPSMRALKETLATIAGSESSVIITGESGTGKELVARAIHELSPRAKKPFVAVNCAAFPENLLESELFGHERGAFTGANRRRPGRFHAAHQGVLFLDEVAEMPPAAQVKLLRVLQEGVFEPLGTNESVKVDVRVLSACNVNLKARVEAGAFRDDLYYRLKVFQLDVPPLRERAGDLALLTSYFLDQMYRRQRTGPRQLSAEAWAALSSYSFPGNVRELQHAVEHAVVLAGSDADQVELDHLPVEVRTAYENNDALQPLSDAVDDFERQYLIRALESTGGHKTRTADLLDVSRKTLWLKLRRHGID